VADASALVYVGIDPDTGTPSSLNAFGSGDVISEVIGGTGRTNLSGLFSSVGNVPVTYNTTTRQFVIQDVSGVSATVDFESVRSALAQASAAVGFNGQNLTNVTNLDVSGDLILSGYTDGKALFVSSNGLIIGRTLITGVARTATSPQPAPNAGSILRYSTTDSEYQAAADVRVGSGGALELYNGVGLEIVNGGYISMVGGGILAIGTGGSLAVTGTASVSSLAVSSNATVSGSLSAANYLNLPSSLVTWGSATSATNSYSSTNAYSSTLANSSTNAYSSTYSLSSTSSLNSTQAPNNFTVTGNLSATTYLNLPSATLLWYEANNAQRVLKYVKNGTAASMPKGTPVTVTGTTGDVANVAALSSVNTHVPEAPGFSNHVFGLTDTTIAAGAFGYIVTEGAVSGNGGDPLNTSLFSGGDILYVSSNGQLNNIRPPAPYEAHPVGYVVRSQANNGIIYVKIETVPEFNDIVGMNLNSSLVNGDLISYDLTTSTFKNVQSINISGTIKGGTVSATTFLNLPSSTVVWQYATSATNSYSATLANSSTNSYSSTNAYSSTLANSSTNAYSSTLSLSATDVVNAGPVDATYLTLTSNTKLTGERTFTAGTGLTGIDGGANSTYTLNADNTSPIWTAGVMFSKSLEGTSPVSNGDLIYYDSVGDNWSIIPSSTVAGAGGGAPTTAQYLTLATDATLTNERVLVANGGLSSNDGGAGGNFTVSANYASAIWNANKIQSTTVNSTAPSKSHNLKYVSTGEWKPNWNEVSTITATSVTLTTDIDHWFASAVNGPMNLTLPAANTCQGKQMSIIKVDTSGQVVTVSGGSITTILNRVKMRMPREQVELLSTGSEWVVLSHDRDYGGDTMDSDTNAVFDDFIQGSTETGEAGYAGWSFTNGSITALAATTFSGSMGAFRRASGTTANQVASFYPLNAGTNTTVLTEHCVEFKLRGRASTTGTDHTVQLGLTSDLTTITPVNGFYFERAAASGTWDAVTRRASAERRINTGITYQNTADPDTFRIFIKDLNNVQFYINDVLVANETNVSNTIPLAGIAVLPGFNITPTTTTARNFDVDYIAYTFDAIQERY